MAASERAYSSSYYEYNSAYQERQRTPLYYDGVGAYPGQDAEEDRRIRRTRERPKRENVQPHRSKPQPTGLTVAELRQLVAVAAFVAVLLIGVLVLNAYAANIQCSINKITKQNMALEDEIDELNMKIDSSTSIEQIESYAMKNLNMSYPKNGQSIYISKDTPLMDNFSQVLKEKAYGNSEKTQGES